MTRRAFGILTAALALAVCAGCGSTAHTTTPAVRSVTPTPAASPTDPLFLADFDDGTGVVRAGRDAPVWRDPGAVGALDGSAVFSIRAGRGVSHLVRLDPNEGTATSAGWPVPAGLSISAVAPAGRWIAITDRTRGYGAQGRTSTDLAIFDSATGTTSHLLSLPGDLQPEAFSTDGTLVFVLRYFPGHYRVETIEIANGTVVDTIDRDKVPVEDMHGHAVHGVMSADRTLLATLYRDPTDGAEPAFVHVLDLAHGWSYCADLPAPFGTGAPGTDAVQLLADDVLEVAATQANRVADLHIEAVRTPLLHVPISYRNGTIPAPPSSITSIPGFDHIIAPIAG